MFKKTQSNRVTLLVGSFLLAASGFFFQIGIAQAGVSQEALQTILVEVRPQDPSADFEGVEDTQSTAELDIDGDADRRFDGNFDAVQPEDHSITIRETAELDVTAPDADYEDLRDSGAERSIGRIDLAELDVNAPDADYEDLRDSGAERSIGRIDL
ncbi:MAG: hypothetical protein V3V56_07740, partial [bacterium]